MTNKYKILSIKERIPYYYRFIGKLKDKEIKKTNSEEIASMFGFKSKSTVTQNLMEILGKAGRKKYGYNTNYVYKVLQQILMLDSPCYAYVMGPILPFMHLDEIQNRNIIITDQEPKSVRVLIITDSDITDISDVLKSHLEIETVINFTSNIYNTGKTPIINFDFLEILLSSLKTAEYEIVPDDISIS